MGLTPPPVSYLFVPGNRPDRFAKAAASGADRVVIDLEDAVAPAGKQAAREQVAQALASGALRACLRINGTGTPWFDADCALLALPGVVEVMLPKAETAAGLAALAARTGLPLLPIIETARGLAEVDALAGSAGVQRLVFGSVDFQLDLGIDGDGDELLFARSALVLASRLANLAAPVDGVTLATMDAAPVRADAARARRLGFGAKLCIHPAQIAAVTAAFAFSDADIAWARRVLAADAGQGGAIAVDGQMIDRPVIERARLIVARHGVAPAQRPLAADPFTTAAGGHLSQTRETP